MKLRLHANTLRLRLNRAEVASFAEHGYVEESVGFAAGQRLSFSMEASRHAAQPHALYEGRAIKILVPEAAAKDWTVTDRVSIESAPADGPRILIEKDFQCLHREGAEPEAYPNPLAAEVD